jgi:hypothetical protein
MHASLAPRPAVTAAFESFIDYAGLYPPARLSAHEATAEYARESRGPHAWILGGFVVAVSRIGEILAHGGEAFPLSLILDVNVSGGDTTAWFAGLREMLHETWRVRDSGRPVKTLEIALPELRQRRETHDAAIGQVGALLSQYREQPVLAPLRAAAYVEWPRGARWRDDLPNTLAAVARAGLGAKLRCGGLTADQIPTVEDVASFIAAAAGAGVRFKATAGLHHPVRRYDGKLGWMHGFLNLLAAAIFAPGANQETIASIVAEEDPHAFAFGADSFAWRERSADVHLINKSRTDAFVSYGSCSFSEPIEDLTALRILPATSAEVP